MRAARRIAAPAAAHARRALSRAAQLAPAARAGVAAPPAGSRSMSLVTKVGDIFTPTEEHGALRSTLRAFVEAEVEPQALAANRAEAFNVPLFRKLGDLGLLGITADEAHGGSGMDATAVVIAHEELAASDPAFCLSYLAHTLLFVNNLNFNGSEAQKAAFLPRACTGDLLGGMCMSEPGAGTDVLGMGTTAVAVEGGAAWQLTGNKMWITNGARAEGELGDAFLVYARTGGGMGSAGRYSLFLVEKGMPGFSLGQRIKDKCGMRASNTAELVFDAVRVPAATHMVGREGDALAHMMRNLEIERLALAAMSLGIARRSVEVMNAYARERKAFDQPLNRFGQIQRHIGESYAEYMAGRSYVYNVARSLDLAASGNRVDSDAVKLYCSVMATTVANRAMQVLGGYGYCGEYVVERLWRDAKLLEIGGGTVEAHQKNMTRDLSKVHKLP
jgi:isovaleryl-CoA dehydrogenase